MKIRRLTALQLPVELRKPVRHASHERTANETLIIRCELADGSVGWGEGLPRTYVTGDSMESVWRHLQETDFVRLAGGEFVSPVEAARAASQFPLANVEPDPGVTVRECFGNPVRCALEVAIVDAVCRSTGISVGDLIVQLASASPLIQQSSEVRYSGAVTSMSPRKQWISALKMRIFGFPMVKVKIGTDGISDVDCLRRVRRVVGSGVDLRLDANEAWRCEDVVRYMQPLLPFGPTSLEQPVPHADVSGLNEVRRALPTPIMLDESLCCQEDAERAIAGEWCDLFNIRLSKCGGLVRSVELAEMARSAGLGFQLGCQVGETAILSAAGRHFACNLGPIRYIEGSFDRFLVRDAYSHEDITFRYGGRGPRLNGPGLGITIRESAILSAARKKIELL
ncbi:MAG: hypothetical protein KDA96_08010 [Planctomycetaceae bacterium]|nr:hypothetical protein [Planctomycetaceae bacterium]